MPSPDARLILLTFPQRWEAGFLSVRVLALPRGNPLAALPGTDDELRLRLMARLAGGPLTDVPDAEERRAA